MSIISKYVANAALLKRQRVYECECLEFAAANITDLQIEAQTAEEALHSTTPLRADWLRALGSLLHPTETAPLA